MYDDYHLFVNRVAGGVWYCIYFIVNAFSNLMLIVSIPFIASPHFYSTMSWLVIGENTQLME